MLGLDQLDIRLKWRFRKAPPGSQSDPMPGEILCDLGGKLTTGIIDPHDSPHLSATAAIWAKPHLVLNHLLGPLNKTYQAGIEIERKEVEFTFVAGRTHWDGLCAFVLCDHLARKGAGPFPPWALELVKSANKVDHGEARIKGDNLSAPFLLHYALNAKHKEDLAQVCLEGADMIRKVGEHFSRPGSKVSSPFLSALPDEEEFAELRNLASINERDLALFEEDLSRKIEPEIEVYLPNQEGGVKKAKTLMFLEPPTSSLYVFWSRSKFDYDLLIVPKCNKQGKIIKWTISVDPRTGFSMERLGYRLEELEKRKRNELGEAPRGGRPRWGDGEYSDNEDPWYDGRDHEYTLVDSPRSGTRLSDPEEVKRVLESPFYGVSLARDEATGGAKLPRFISYLFFEVDTNTTDEDFEREFPQEKTPFKDLAQSFSFVQGIKLRCPAGELSHPDLQDYDLRLFASKVTRHALLEIECKKVRDGMILEEAPEFVNRFKEDVSQIGAWIREEYNLTAKVWGERSFSLVIFMDPDLHFHEKEKLQRLFSELTSNPVSLEAVQSLRERSLGDDVLSSSASVCVLRQRERNQLDEDRKAIAFYALFIKTAYRRFSQRLEPLTENEDMGQALDEILDIQKDFSRFLATYDFSGTEISMDGEVTKFFDGLTGPDSLGLEEQKKETHDEMQLIANLASSIENRQEKQRVREEEERAGKLKVSIILLSLIAMCDFLYALSKDILSELIPEPTWLHSLGLTLVLPICIAVVLLLANRKKRARKRIAEDQRQSP
tara:strand:- start:472 stop:2799 length:2328 start_codon:yes stop_codon:yes gene_type:complete